MSHIPYAAPIEWYRAWVGGTPLPRVPLNSCRIVCCGGVQTLSVPLEGGRRRTRSLPYEEITLSEHGDWRHLHWGALYSAYGRAPYFEYYGEMFHDIYSVRRTTLAELNSLMHRAVCRVMQIGPVEAPNLYAAVRPELLRSGEPYHQVWEERYGFIPGLSILDLAFNLGPEAIFHLL